MQLDDDCREEIYSMCDVVAAYYNIDRTTVDEHGEPRDTPDSIPGTINMRSLGTRFSVKDSDDEE
jgi:hypothetical protein